MATNLTGNPVKDCLLRKAAQYEQDANLAERGCARHHQEANDAAKEAQEYHRLAALFREAASAL
jgi:hypothetical protein